MDYRRIMRYSFRKDCDYNTMCKIYRNYMFENDLAATLKEKLPGFLPWIVSWALPSSIRASRPA